MADNNGTADDDRGARVSVGNDDALEQAHAERDRSHRIAAERIRPEPLAREPRRPPKKQHDDDDDESSDQGDDDSSDKAEPKKAKKGKESDEETSDDKDEDDEEKPRKWSHAKRITVALIIAAVVLLLAALALMYYLHSRHFEKTDDAFIDAHYETVAPQVSGRVMRVTAPDNAQVEPGQTLVQIDPSDYQVSVDRAKAAVLQAMAQVTQNESQRKAAEANHAQALAAVDVAQANLDNANSQLRRYEALSKEAVSAQQLVTLQTTARVSTAQFVSAQKSAAAQVAQVELAGNQITAAQANLWASQKAQAQAELNLSYTTVKATTGGRVTQRQVQAGDYVTPGQQLLILTPHDVYVTANYKETQITDMRPGQAVELSVDAFPGETFHGKVDSVQRSSGTIFSLLPPQNATGNYVKVVQRVPVKITFDDQTTEAYGRLGPGMSVGPSVRVR